jgi:UDP-N-acetyl-D-glucosamine dehydrogenase
LPVDPSYLSWQVKKTLGHSFRFVELANDVNEHMPDYVVQRVMAGLNAKKKALNGSRVLLLGISYKKNTGDDRESPALRVAELLLLQGAEVVAVDPFVQKCRVEDVTMSQLSDAEISSSDAIVILTDHDDFDYDLVAKAEAFVLDTRNRLGGQRDTL